MKEKIFCCASSIELVKIYQFYDYFIVKSLSFLNIQLESGIFRDIPTLRVRSLCFKTKFLFFITFALDLCGFVMFFGEINVSSDTTYQIHRVNAFFVRFYIKIVYF